MGILENKSGLIMGIANHRSLAAAIANRAHAEGAAMGFSHLPDASGKMAQRLTQVVAELDPRLVYPCDVNNDDELDGFFAEVEKSMHSLDFLVHAIAFAPLADIRSSTLEVSRAGFVSALESSVYSFIATARRAAQLMPRGGSLVTLSYFGGEKVVPGYNLMGIAKAALESAMRYLAYELGPKGIRVNAVSAGPVKTLASSAIGDFSSMLSVNEAIAPLNRNITSEEVANATCFLLSDLASGITGELLHVDSGYNTMGSPGRALNQWLK
jgi:enoyl-[acyl-carrier protein] reductase I